MAIDKGSNQPKVSVVIPAYNSAKTIHFCLHSLCQQTYKNKEVIVVDKFSSDNTTNIARRYNATVYQHGTERASQLNYGIHKATGDYIFETGSDMTSDPTYIEEAIAKCKEGYDAIYSSVVSRPQKSYWGRVKALERETYIGCREVECAHFFRREVFMELGGYDERLIGIEEDFQHRLDKEGFRTGRINAKEIHREEAGSLTEVARKSYYYGSYLRHYLGKYPIRGSVYLLPLRPAYIKKAPLLLSNPILTFGLIMLKVVQYVCGFTGFLSNSEHIHKRIYGESSTHKSPTQP